MSTFALISGSLNTGVGGTGPFGGKTNSGQVFGIVGCTELCVLTALGLWAGVSFFVVLDALVTLETLLL